RLGGRLFVQSDLLLLPEHRTYVRCCRRPRRHPVWQSTTGKWLLFPPADLHRINPHDFSDVSDLSLLLRARQTSQKRVLTKPAKRAARRRLPLPEHDPVSDRLEPDEFRGPRTAIGSRGVHRPRIVPDFPRLARLF